jgi:signal transduction histidine kinase
MTARFVPSLTALTRAASECDDPQSLKELAVRVVAGALGADYCAIWEAPQGEGATSLRASVGWPESISGEEAESLAIHAWPGPAPLLVEDWGTEARVPQPAMLGDRGIRSSLYVAIPERGEGYGDYGVLGVDSPSPHAFGSPELDFAEAAANLISLALCKQAARHDAVIQERLRLARELHDSVTQAIYSITLQAQAAARLLAAGDVKAAGSYVGELGDAAQEVLEEMRLLIFELRPPLLEQVGLPLALRARLDAVEARANLETELIVEASGRLPTEVEQVLYRIAQEALNNALRHASARHIAVHLHQTQATVQLSIRDDGVGFDPAEARSKGGLGLRSIEERVGHAGGKVTLRSSPGAGTELLVEVPL